MANRIVVEYQGSSAFFMLYIFISTLLLRVGTDLFHFREKEYYCSSPSEEEV